MADTSSVEPAAWVDGQPVGWVTVTPVEPRPGSRFAADLAEGQRRWAESQQ